MKSFSKSGSFLKCYACVYHMTRPCHHLCIYPGDTKTCIYTKTRTWIFIPALFVIVKKKKTTNQIRPKCPSIWWVDTQAEADSCNGLLISNRREGTINTHSNMEEAGNNYAEWKKSDRKKSIYEMIPFI